jgi:hypothetical protein
MTVVSVKPADQRHAVEAAFRSHRPAVLVATSPKS